MSFAKTRRHELIDNELTKEDFHEIENVSDIELESYALSSIIIERLWPFQRSFLEANPFALVPMDEHFWTKLHEMFVATSQAFTAVRLAWLGEQLQDHDDQSRERRALIRYLVLRKRIGSLGLPAIDDAYFFCIQMTRVAIALDPEEAVHASIHKPIGYLMAQNRPFSRWILRSISPDPHGAEQDLTHPFLASAFRLHRGALEFDPGTKTYFEKMAPVFAKRYEEEYGKSLRSLQCPVLYTNPQIFTEIITWIVAEIRRQYFSRLLV